MHFGFAPILIVLFIAVILGIVGGAYYLGTQKGSSEPTPIPTIVPRPTLQASPIPSLIPNPTPTSTSTPKPTTKPVQNGVSLENIKYTLPSGWISEIANNTLHIHPTNQFGVWIKVYDYPNNIGRREYYCQVVNYCIQGTTKFTDTNIGNISGYIAAPLDNSGGGAEYFGAKGNKFYIISIAPGLNGSDRQAVLNSLVF